MWAANLRLRVGLMSTLTCSTCNSGLSLQRAPADSTARGVDDTHTCTEMHKQREEANSRSNPPNHGTRTGRGAQQQHKKWTPAAVVRSAARACRSCACVRAIAKRFVGHFAPPHTHTHTHTQAQAHTQTHSLSLSVSLLNLEATLDRPVLTTERSHPLCTVDWDVAL
uniref:Secreted protein n=1 Tax=Eutreptiella gymnastica TaxID=73025 RepID=A0A7S4D429_9EUGL